MFHQNWTEPASEPIKYRFDRFSKAVQKALEYIDYKKSPKKESGESLYVNSEYKLVKIILEDIEYIESLEDYIRIHLINAKPVLTLLSMKKVLEKLPANKFKRIHRSYIIPTDKVVAIHNRKVQLKTGKELPISDSYTDFISDWQKKI